MIAREEARLRALFGQLLAASLVAGGAACSPSESPGGSAEPAEKPDATTGIGIDGGQVLPSTDASTSLAIDAHDSACDPTYVDGEADGSGCDYFERLACNLPAGAATEGCAVYEALCSQICGQVFAYPCDVVECGDAGVIPSGPITIECTTGMLGCADGGRRPAGLVEASLRETPAPGETALGAWLARMAWMEAASVHSFRRLAGELEQRGAPSALVTEARRSAGDEARHARVVARLARAYGGSPPRAKVGRVRGRTRLAFARENAVEGCVREAFGALVATWQARHAPDVAMAAIMSEIAEDETRHAALAWSVARWLEPGLTRGDRAQIRRAMAGATAALRCEVASLPPALARAAGLPFGAEGVALVDAFARALLA